MLKWDEFYHKKNDQSRLIEGLIRVTPLSFPDTIRGLLWTFTGV